MNGSKLCAGSELKGAMSDAAKLFSDGPQNQVNSSTAIKAVEVESEVSDAVT
jgi:hypothetical protein